MSGNFHTSPLVEFSPLSIESELMPGRAEQDARLRHGPDIGQMADESLVDPFADIHEPPSVLAIQSAYGERINICSAGSFSVVIGKAKSRKTFLLTTLAAAAMSDGIRVLDVVIGSMPEGRDRVAVFDTEQSHFYAHRFARRICDMVERFNHSKLQFRHLQPYTPEQRLSIIEHVIRSTPTIGLVIVDGLRDLLTRGINDEEEATAITSRILNLVHTYQIHMIFVLHQNKNDLNARGHIGTEVINKAETVLSVTKDDKDKSVSVVKAEFCRGMEPEPFSFSIDANGLPVLMEVGYGKPSKKKDQANADNFNHILSGQKILSYAEIVTEYAEISGKSEITAKRHVGDALKQGIIMKTHSGHYRLPDGGQVEDVPF